MKTLASTDDFLAATAAGAQTRAVARTAPLRVLHVINRLDMGGTEYGILKVIAGLGNENFEHALCAIRGFDAGLAQERKLENKIFVAAQKDAGFEFLLFRLRKIMRAYQPHIVHSRNWGAIEAIAAARLAGVPVAIHSEHGYEVDMLEGLPRRRRVLRRALYGMADAVFTVTGDLRSYHAQQAWVAADRIRVLHNGVDTQRFAPRPEKRRKIRQQLGLPEEGFVVGTVGRMVPIKDHATLLTAARALTGRGMDVHVALAGSGPELARHQQFVASSPQLAGRVSFLGAAQNIPDVLNALDVFVLPSLREGMSNTILEAMASGLTVMVTRVGGNPELVEDDRSGWLFAPGDAADLAARLERLAGDADLRQRMGAAARERAVEHFRLERMVDDYRNLYLELAQRRGILKDGQA